MLRWVNASGIALLFAAPASAADVDVTIHGINSNAGRITCRVFADVSGLPIRGALQTVHGAIADGASPCSISGLPVGRYAVAMLHDANDNSKLDKSLLGLPTEAQAFSQRVHPTIGVPSF